MGPASTPAGPRRVHLSTVSRNRKKPLSKPIGRGARTRVLPDVHPDLEGFDVELNSFGEVDMTIPIDRLNDFLDREVDDPKLTQWGFGDGERSGGDAEGSEAPV